MGKAKKERLEQIEIDITVCGQRIEELGEKLIAFGGSRATRSQVLRDYTWHVKEWDRLQERRVFEEQHWWEKL